MLKIKKQIRTLYLSSVLGNLSLTGAWVAILAARGFSLPQIGFAETVFHITSLIFEIPSGILADVFGRKRMLAVSTIMGMISDVIMILSRNFADVCLSIAFRALAYNFASGSDEALAYDSLKSADMPDKYEKYVSTQLVIYRLFSGISTLFAGFALTIGHRIAYSTGLVTAAIQLILICSLTEVRAADGEAALLSAAVRTKQVIAETFAFMKTTKRAWGLMLSNSLVGAFDILLLFFLQAKLPEKGTPMELLGVILLLMSTGGIVGSKLILKFPKLKYRTVFGITAAMVLSGIFLEHSPSFIVMAAGGFLAAVGDDALQVRTNARLQDMFPSEQRATLTSLESFSFSVIMIFLSPLAGVFFARW